MKTLIIALALLVSVWQAGAACVKPIGKYFGFLITSFIDLNGAASQMYSRSRLTATVASNLSASISEIGSTWDYSTTFTPFSRSWTAPALGPDNSFSTTTCAGQFTNSDGVVFVYFSSSGGNQLSLLSHDSVYFVQDIIILNKL